MLLLVLPIPKCHNCRWIQSREKYHH